MFITFIFSITRLITLETIEIWSQTKDLSTLKQLRFGVRQWLVKGVLHCAPYDVYLHLWSSPSGCHWHLFSFKRR